jgi:hypothetical protein
LSGVAVVELLVVGLVLCPLASVFGFTVLSLLLLSSQSVLV